MQRNRIEPPYHLHATNDAVLIIHPNVVVKALSTAFYQLSTIHPSPLS